MQFRKQHLAAIGYTLLEKKAELVAEKDAEIQEAIAEINDRYAERETEIDRMLAICEPYEDEPEVEEAVEVVTEPEVEEESVEEVQADETLRVVNGRVVY